MMLTGAETAEMSGRPEQNTEITQILGELSHGEPSAAERLLPHVYEELRALAGSFFRQQRADHTLQPTALVHEAYVKLVGSRQSHWESRKHFFDVAAMAMRQLLADHARRQKAAKRGGDLSRVTLIDSGKPAPHRMDVDLIALDEALSKLSELDPRQGRIVELRFLAGLSVDETAEVLGVSARTVKLDWQMARAWLRRELGGD